MKNVSQNSQNSPQSAVGAPAPKTTRKRKRPPKVQLCVRLSPVQYRLLKDRSIDECCTPSDVIRRALSDRFKKPTGRVRWTGKR